MGSTLSRKIFAPAATVASLALALALAPGCMTGEIDGELGDGEGWDEIVEEGAEEGWDVGWDDGEEGNPDTLYALGPSLAAFEWNGAKRIIALTNKARTDRGLRALKPFNTLTELALWRSADMLTRNYFSHTIKGTTKLVYPYMDSQGLKYAWAGENIGWNSGYADADSADRVFAAWMDSPGHRANILDPKFTHIGVGVEGQNNLSFNGYTQNPRMFTQLFMESTSYGAPDPTTGFNDTYETKFRTDIAWLAANGSALGCGPQRYCPTSGMVRGQMAALLDQALDLPLTRSNYFDDDAGSLYEGAINRLAAAKITSGCGSRKYCPGGTVLRDQMASFLARAYALPAASTNYFDDDAGNTHEANINRIAEAGITTGCGYRQYCPKGTTLRQQMAAFLHRAAD